MRRFAFNWLWLTAGFLGGPALGQTVAVQNEGLQWLQRVSTAAQKLNYSGIFVYRNGVRSETSRVVHLANNGNQIEKLEVLDGSPREVIRHNDEVRCYLPENRLVIVEQRSTRRSFPALLPVSLVGLTDHYLIRKGVVERVAGLDSQIIRLDPRDPWRYGRQLWVDIGSGLLMKADIFSAQGESLESMAFTDLRIGEPASADAVKSSYAAAAKEHWQLRQARLSDMRDDGPWQFRVELPGFRRQSSMRRSTGKDPNDLSMLHWIFSDGLVAMSVFISPATRVDETPEEGLQTIGALSIMKRIIDGYQVVVMGDVPPAAVKHFAEGIGLRGK